MLRAMVIRNLKLYFRDKAAVFFSLLGVMLIILLYVLFLGRMVSSMAGDFLTSARFFSDSWVMAGVIAATSMTTCLAGFGIMVDDKAKKISLDFESAPIPRAKLVLAYVLASVLIGLVMTLFTFVLGEIYIVLFGGQFLSLAGILKVLGVIILSVSASSAMVFFLVSTIKSPNAFGTLSTVIGSLIGFLAGIYVPIGNLPEMIQGLVKIVPVSHGAAALRQVMMQEAFLLEQIPEDVKTFMGIQFLYGGDVMPFWAHLAILGLTFVIFYALSVMLMRTRKNKE